MKDNRQRIVRINDKIIITNYKCMYTSLNRLNIDELNPNDSDKYEKIFLYRDTNIRVISNFLNWMIRLPLVRNILDENTENNDFGWFIPILKNNNYDFKLYKQRLRNLNNENLIELFKDYLQILPTFYLENMHTQPQTKIIKENNFKIDIFINIDDSNQIKLLEQKVNQEIPKSNKSKDTHKILLITFLNENEYYNNFINKLYLDDKILFV